MIVCKFGGTSVGSPEAIHRLVSIIQDGEHAGRVRVVVVSAFSKVTDGLIDLARRAEAGDGTYGEKFGELRNRHLTAAEELVSRNQRKSALDFIHAAFADLGRILDGITILGELSDRSLDSVMSFGERLSAFIVAHAFRAAGTQADFLDARLAIKTDNHFGAALYRREESYAGIRNLLETRKQLQVATGFIGSTEDGKTTTLGRGGSDLSAAIFGAAIGAEEVEIWTDVDGILTSDPRLVKNAFRLESISYIEAMELSHFGAKVLHPPTVQPALQKGIPIRIRNTFNPGCPGTVISEKALPSEFPIRGISSMREIALLRIQGSGMMGVAGFSSRLFGCLAKKHINIILITQASSEYSICFAVLPKDALPAAAAIKEEFERELATRSLEPPVVEKDLSIIAVVGERMKHSAGIAGKIFHALGQNGINIVAIAQGSSELNISAAIARSDESKALNAIHEAFFLSGLRSVNLFLMSPDLVGRTLLEQLQGQKDYLADRHRIRINIAGISDGKRMVFSPEGIDPGSVLSVLAEEGEALDLEDFSAKALAMNLPNSAFCDCSDSRSVTALYPRFLHGAIPVISPNKQANLCTYDEYKTLTEFARDRGIPFLNDAAVCAGLPVLTLIRDLILSGDRILKIEAVLSGVLSFIFNKLDSTVPFSTLVDLAMEKGYGENHPGKDHGTLDAARKALVLARECGMPVEFEDIQAEALFPEGCTTPGEMNTLMEKRRLAAAEEGRVLRYMATIEAGKITLSLGSYERNSPAGTLREGENLVMISSERYPKLPLVLKGPGAGVSVIAGSVFADIIRIARTLV